MSSKMATEHRLIDANALKDRWTIPSPEPINTDAAEVLDSIDEQPTVDAVPVVHGRWEEIEDFDGERHWKCTACGNEWYFEVGTPEENNCNYCPLCGAKMDGGTDNG